MLTVVCCLVFVDCCLLCIVYCLLLFVPRCLLLVVGCLLYVVCRLQFMVVVCYLLFSSGDCWFSFVVDWLMFVVFGMVCFVLCCW